jgi:hypothetical protein
MAENNLGNTQGDSADERRDDRTDSRTRNKEQRADKRGEAQNVNDDTGRPLEEQELDHARNKAMEGQKQDRDVGSGGTNSKTTT